MKIFVCYIGGATATSRIELHDLQLFVGEKVEDGFDYLKKQWWGLPESLHLDCWGALEAADGHAITLRKTPAQGEDKLWFVNLGGYDPAEFSELHKNVFVVAPTESKAKVRALKTILNWKSHHKDEMFEVEQVSCLDDIAQGQGYYIHLAKTDAPRDFAFECGYWPIGKNKPRTA
jgi:hypothetical protein